MIFQNKHYIKWNKELKSLINKNIKAIKNNSISKITIVNNRFSKFLLFISYKLYALIKHILTFNYSKAQLKIVKYFTIFITLLMWIFVVFAIYANNITNITSFIHYIKNIWDPLIEGLHHKSSLQDYLTNFLNNFKNFNEYLEDNFIENLIENSDINNKTNYENSSLNNRIPNKPLIVEEPSDIWTNAIIGIGLVIVMVGIYYGITYLGNNYFGPGITPDITPDISPNATPTVRGVNLPITESLEINNRLYHELRGLGVGEAILDKFESAKIPLEEVYALYNRGLSCDRIYNYYELDNLTYQDILTVLNNNTTDLNTARTFASFTTNDMNLGGTTSGSKPWTTLGYDVTPITENSGLLREHQSPILTDPMPSTSMSPIITDPITTSSITPIISDSVQQNSSVLTDVTPISNPSSSVSSNLPSSPTSTSSSGSGSPTVTHSPIIASDTDINSTFSLEQ